MGREGAFSGHTCSTGQRPEPSAPPTQEGALCLPILRSALARQSVRWLTPLALASASTCFEGTEPDAEKVEQELRRQLTLPASSRLQVAPRHERGVSRRRRHTGSQAPSWARHRQSGTRARRPRVPTLFLMREEQLPNLGVRSLPDCEGQHRAAATRNAIEPLGAIQDPSLRRPWVRCKNHSTDGNPASARPERRARPKQPADLGILVSESRVAGGTRSEGSTLT
jgi:hypothetical protein